MESKQPNTSLSASRPERVIQAEPVNELPRAVLRPNTYLLLDGEWRFIIDAEDKGVQQQWYVGHSFDGTVHWPGSIEAHMAQTKG